MYLRPESVNAAANFFETALWKEIKECLMRRRPSFPDQKSEATYAIAQCNRRNGFEECIEEMESLPSSVAGENNQLPAHLNRPAITYTKD